MRMAAEGRLGDEMPEQHSRLCRSRVEGGVPSPCVERTLSAR
jgi:hypothetical protein